MYAIATALVAPTNSKTAPKSQVIRLSVIADTTRLVLKIKCLFMLNGSSGKK